MNAKVWAWMAAAGLCAPIAYADKQCVLQRGGELPVTMAGTRPLVSGHINGNPARFLADSGAFFSLISRDALEMYGLKVSPLAPNFRVRGTSGNETMGVAKAAKFSLDGFSGGRTFEGVEFLITTQRFGFDTVGIIGQNILGTADAEYDLANGMIRLFRKQDCKGTMLAYWAGDKSVADMELEPTTALSPHLVGHALLNGKKIRVMFDTGASTSVMTLKAARRAGIEPEDEEVKAGGLSQGIGKKANENWIARFETLDLGGEVIKNARLRIADIQIGDRIDLLLGADFFLSHRLYVAAKDRRLFFTYNGGPVFDLRSDRERGTISAAAPASPADANALEDGASAAELRRRGAASASRRDFRAALAALDRAVTLEPSDPENFYQRGLAYWRSGQPRLASGDFDQALKLSPQHVPALMSRGALHLGSKDKVSATADLDLAATIAANDPEISLQVAKTFLSYDHFDEAIARYDAWQAKYPKDRRVASMLNDRCWSRAMLNRELDVALADCDLAIKKGGRNSDVYDSRAFVHLRMGNFDAALADYGKALELQPKHAVSLYGQGLAKMKKGLRSEGEADMAAAVALEPSVTNTYRKTGLVDAQSDGDAQP